MTLNLQISDERLIEIIAAGIKGSMNTVDIPQALAFLVVETGKLRSELEDRRKLRAGLVEDAANLRAELDKRTKQTW